MDKEAHEHWLYHVQEAGKYETMFKAERCLAECRSGQIENNGHNLYVFGKVITRRGISLEQLGTNQEEIENFLVQDLKAWIERVRLGQQSADEDSWDLITLMVDTLDQNFQPATNGIFNRLGITIAELNDLEHRTDLKAAKEELELYRTQGPSNKFFGLRQNLATDTVKLEEIGATQEEIDKYSKLYDEKYNLPYVRTIHAFDPK